MCLASLPDRIEQRSTETIHTEVPISPSRLQAETQTPGSPGDPPPASPGSLDRSLVTGVAWTSAGKFAVQLVRWLSTLLIARILAPADYGIVGMAVLFTGLIALVSEFGVGAAIVHRQDRLSEDQIARLGGVALLTGLGLAGLSALAAPLVAGFFSEPGVRPVVMALSLQFVSEALRVVPRSLMTRDLQFRALALIEVVEGVVLALATLTLALLGAGYWALVGGLLIHSAVGTIASFLVRSHRIAWPRDLRSILSEVKFGFHLVLSRIGWYTYSNADFGVIGRIFGKSPLGDYTIGWNLASVPVERITSIVSRIALPIFSRLQDDAVEFRRSLRNITQALSIITFPVAVGLALVAEPFVLVVLGDKWVGAIEPLRILALAAVLRSITPVLSPALIGIGRPDLASRFSLFGALVLPAAFVVAALRWGMVGVAWVWLLVYPVLAFGLQLRWTCRESGLRVRNYLLALWPATAGTAGMAAVVLFVEWEFLRGTAPVVSLFVSSAVGMIAYGLIMGVVFREKSVRMLELVRSLRS